MTSVYERYKMMFAENQVFKTLMGTIHSCHLILWGYEITIFCVEGKAAIV